MTADDEVHISFLQLGRYEGLWKSHQSDCEYEIVIDENNLHPYQCSKFGPYAFEGYFEWRIIAGSEYKSCIGRQAKEKIRGFFFKDTKNMKNIKKKKDRYHFLCLGYAMVEVGDERYLGHDGYNIVLNPKLNIIKTKTMGHSCDWNNPMTLYRTACRRELLEMLYENSFLLKEKGIIDVIVMYLQHFEQPDREVHNQWSFNNKLKAIDRRLRPLFQDLDYTNVK